MKPSPLSLLVPAVLVVAVLCRLLTKGGWIIWIPVLPALAVVGYLVGAARR